MPENQLHDPVDEDELDNRIFEDPDMIRQQQFIMDNLGNEEEVELESEEDEEPHQ